MLGEKSIIFNSNKKYFSYKFLIINPKHNSLPFFWFYNDPFFLNNVELWIIYKFVILYIMYHTFERYYFIISIYSSINKHSQK